MVGLNGLFSVMLMIEGSCGMLSEKLMTDVMYNDGLNLE